MYKGPIECTQMTGEEKEDNHELCLDQKQYFVVPFIVSVDEILGNETRLLLKQLSLRLLCRKMGQTSLLSI